MAAPSNDNQGLKIAVACFVMLSMILAVSTYFGFSNYALADKKLEEANKAVNEEKTEQQKLLKAIGDIKEKAGYPKAEYDVVPKKIADDIEELKKQVAAIAEDCRKTVDTYKSSGGSMPKVDELKASVDTIVSAFNDPNNTLQSSAFRLRELLHNQALLNTTIALEFHNARGLLETQDQANDAKLQVETEALKASKRDLEAEITKHEQDRQTLMSKVDVLQTDTNKQAQEIAKLKNQIAQMDDDFRKRSDELLTQVRTWRDIVEKKETVLDVKDGTVTFVDYGRNEVRTDISRKQGAHEQMVFSIFDRNAAGIPSDKVKGTIQLIQVSETGSIGRIISTSKPSEPLRTGDQVYSAVWDPNKPLQFALIGKIDINRDGRDDRTDLKRMIEQAGGAVVYDLPPSNVGTETGKLTPLISWYVVDERDPFHPPTDKNDNIGEDETFLRKRTEAIRIARADGIRPMSIERALAYLGYRYNAKASGRVEAADRKSIQGLLNPKGRVGALPPSDATTTPPDAPETSKDGAAEPPK